MGIEERYVALERSGKCVVYDRVRKRVVSEHGRAMGKAVVAAQKLNTGIAGKQQRPYLLSGWPLCHPVDLA